jgi:ATP-dependent RNA helicase DDX55/SPB4
MARVQWDAYAYADGAQEAKRRAALTQAGDKAAQGREVARARAERKVRNEAWSHEGRRKDERERRKDKKKKRRAWEKEQAGQQQATAGHEAANETAGEGDGGNDDDWDELAEEARAAKKVRRVADVEGAFGDL